MKYEAQKLYNFLDKATLGGEIATGNLKIENNTLKIWILSINNTIAINAELKNFNTPNDIWPIKDIKLLLQSLKLFNGVVEIVHQENKLSIFDKDRQIDIVLADESFIENNLSKKISLEYLSKVRINSDIFIRSIKNKNIVKATNTKIECVNNVLTLTVGNSNFDTITEKQELIYNDFCSVFATPLDGVVSKLDDAIEVGFKSDYPVTIRMFNDEYDIQYVVAHIQDLEK